MKSHKKQHYVPACYLKGWRDPKSPQNHEPYVWVFDKDGTNPKRRAPSNLFNETDLYTIQKIDGTRDLRIENGLSELEYQFTRIRNSKFNFKRELTGIERVYLCAFVAAAQFRTPSSRDHHTRQWASIADKGDRLLASLKTASPEQIKQYSRVGSSADKTKSMTHEQVKQLASTPLQLMMPGVLKTVTPILIKMNMAVLCTDDPVGFITSDSPCIWFNPESYKLPPIYRAVGLGSKSIEVTMPISPSQCLIFSWGDFKDYINIDSNILLELNNRHIALSSNQFISNSEAINKSWFERRPLPDDAWENKNQDPS